MLGSGPVYPALGNHDSYHQSVMICVFGTFNLCLYFRAQDAPHAIGGALAGQFSWCVTKKKVVFHYRSICLYRNYDHVAGLWEYENWLPDSAVQFARSHYAAYMVKRTDGLRIITLNTDLCKRSHFCMILGKS